MQKKKVLSLALAAASIVSSVGLAGCAKKNTAPVYSRRTNVYKTIDLAGPEKAQWIDQAFCTDDTMVMAYTEYVENITETTAEETEDGTAATTSMEPEYSSTTKRWLYSVNLDGSGSSEFELNTYDGPDAGSINKLFAGPNGTIYVGYQLWISTEDMSYSQLLLYNIDAATGSVNGEPIDLTAAMESAGFPKGESYISSIDYTGSGLVVTIDGSIILCDLNGNVHSKFTTDASWLNGLLYSDNEIYYCSYVQGKGQQLFALDINSGKSENITTDTLDDIVANSGNLVGYADGKFYFNTQAGVTTWERATDTATEILNYINSDIDRTILNALYLLPDGKFAYYGVDYNDNSNNTSVGVLERIPDEQMQDEVILTLACVYTDYYLRQLIIRFNKQNSGVRISIKDYSGYNNEENNWEGAVTQLNNDITVGNVPDILVLDSSLPIKTYYKKGVLTDLYPYINDEENGLDNTDLMSNILQACEYNGKLYSVITSYYLQTLVAKPDYVGTESGWTIREMLDAISKIPEDMVAFSYDFDRASLQEMLLNACLDSFVNWETGETSFDSQEFIDLIEFLKSCPEQSIQSEYYNNIDYNNYDAQADQEWYNNYEMRFYTNKALFLNAYISSFDALTYTMQQFGGNATLIGYPTTVEGSSGAVIYPNMELGICAASKNLSSAWQFFRYLMTDEQYAENNYAFTISKKNMQAKLDQVNKDAEEYGNYEWTDDDWRWYEENYSEEYVNYLKSSRTPYSPEYGDLVMKIANTATTVVRADDNLSDIINEELSSFYAGTKSAADTANVINSRARIYISENS